MKSNKFNITNYQWNVLKAVMDNNEEFEETQALSIEDLQKALTKARSN